MRTGPAGPAVSQALAGRAILHGLTKGRLVTYREDGSELLCKVLSDDSTDGLICWRLEVVREVKPHPFGMPAKPGDVFEAAAVPQFAGWMGWTLEPAPEGVVS